ncbi:hypothetical protein OE88DRAFT_1330337 [Heliocybe sulcata]|uniref:GIY-YIG domain-containing protein n=1 Tax=Heliocybe sulcata TaxID=5364 RepID=A0A5C3N704_9AGAM|nr:hypothetical protein OE88DRAFT_1330337 [Heliocybe sulcata]
MGPGRAATTRSSLIHHTFPPFYACYLLKSIRIPPVRTHRLTYVGSTPDPPKRIRQHNGEICAGARKTVRYRPWVTQMIVYGFPSKLAALQFEWAWGHPKKSRHLKNKDGKKLVPWRYKTLAGRVLVARMMVASHPFRLWPLHVKIFTQDASDAWAETSGQEITNHAILPPGFTSTTELEGVDGKTSIGNPGRYGPIDVTDAPFTSVHLSKYTRVTSSSTDIRCSICHEHLHPPHDPLETALCPHDSCTAMSHLHCLGKDFLSQSVEQVLVPRGGVCNSCKTYVLWGDVVKGCYRRRTDAVVSVPFDDEDEDEDADKIAAPSPPRKRAARKVGTPKKTAAPRTKSKAKGKADSVAGVIAIDAIGDTEEESNREGAALPVTPRKRAARKVATPKETAAPRAKGKAKGKAGVVVKVIDIDAIGGAEEESNTEGTTLPVTPRKRAGRKVGTPKETATPRAKGKAKGKAGLVVKVIDVDAIGDTEEGGAALPATPRKRAGRKVATPEKTAAPRAKGKAKKKADSSAEVIDIDPIGDTEESNTEDTAIPAAPRKRAGRKVGTPKETAAPRAKGKAKKKADSSAEVIDIDPIGDTEESNTEDTAIPAAPRKRAGRKVGTREKTAAPRAKGKAKEKADSVAEFIDVDLIDHSEDESSTEYTASPKAKKRGSTSPVRQAKTPTTKSATSVTGIPTPSASPTETASPKRARKQKATVTAAVPEGEEQNSFDLNA